MDLLTCGDCDTARYVEFAYDRYVCGQCGSIIRIEAQSPVLEHRRSNHTPSDFHTEAVLARRKALVAHHMQRLCLTPLCSTVVKLMTVLQAWEDDPSQAIFAYNLVTCIQYASKVQHVVADDTHVCKYFQLQDRRILLRQRARLFSLLRGEMDNAYLEVEPWCTSDFERVQQDPVRFRVRNKTWLIPPGQEEAVTALHALCRSHACMDACFVLAAERMIEFFYERTGSNTSRQPDTIAASALYSLVCTLRTAGVIQNNRLLTLKGIARASNVSVSAIMNCMEEFPPVDLSQDTSS